MADIFRSNIRVYGKHGQYLEALSPNVREKRKNLEPAEFERLPEIERSKHVFDSYVDVYVIAPIVGYLFQQTADRDSGPDKNIMEGAVASHRDKLIFSYELLMLLDDKSEPDLNERIRRAFRADDKLVEEGMKVFTKYALGGIEVLYEKLMVGATTPEDVLRNLMDFVDEWNENFLQESGELDLNSLFSADGRFL